MPRRMCETAKIKKVFPTEYGMLTESRIILATVETKPSTPSLLQILDEIEAEVRPIKILRDESFEQKIFQNEFTRDFIDERNKVPTIVETYLATCKRFSLVPNREILDCLRGKATTITIRHAKLEPTNIYIALKSIVDDNKIVLSSFDMSYNDNTDKIFLFLNEMLTENETLTWLNISNSFLNQECIDLLANAIENSLALTYLDVSNCDIRDEGGALLMAALRNNELLEEFHIAKNKLHTLTAAAMVPAMKHNKTLRILNLRWNDLYPERAGAMKVALAIRRNRGLENVNLSWNGFSGDSFATAMSGAIRVNKTLDTVDLSNNVLYGSDLLVILDGVQRSNSIKHIYLDNNIWDEFSIFSSRAILKLCVDVETISIGKLAFVSREFDEAAKFIMERIPTLKIIYHGIILPNPPVEVNFQEVILDRCKYLAMKPKKKKFRRDFTDIITTLHYHEKEKITRAELLQIVAQFKPRLDDELIGHFSQIFARRVGKGKSKRKFVFIKEMADFYFKRYNMDIPEPVDPAKYEEKKKPKRSKKK